MTCRGGTAYVQVSGFRNRVTVALALLLFGFAILRHGTSTLDNAEVDFSE